MRARGGRAAVSERPVSHGRKGSLRMEEEIGSERKNLLGKMLGLLIMGGGGKRKQRRPQRPAKVVR